MSPELLAIFDAHNVPETLRAFLLTHGVLSPSQFACTAATEDAIDARLIQASGLDFNFGERIRIITAWHASRATMSAPSSGPGASRSAPAADTMPDGANPLAQSLEGQARIESERWLAGELQPDG